MFVFQACYGTDSDWGYDMLVKGQVVSKSTGDPIRGITVSVVDSLQYDITDEDGSFSFYTEMEDSLTIQFRDIDSTENGQYLDKDTVLTDISEVISLDISLEEK